jgi:hypothetical protein
MHCAECNTRISDYYVTTEYYVTVGEAFHRMKGDGRFNSSEYSKLKTEVERARIVCERATGSLRVHRERHNGQ